MNEKTITICGQEVTLRYCAATETGFEGLRGKSVSEINFDSSEDLIALGICAIVARYSYRDEQPLRGQATRTHCAHTGHH